MRFIHRASWMHELLSQNLAADLHQMLHIRARQTRCRRMRSGRCSTLVDGGRCGRRFMRRCSRSLRPFRHMRRKGRSGNRGLRSGDRYILHGYLRRRHFCPLLDRCGRHGGRFLHLRVPQPPQRKGDDCKRRQEDTRPTTQTRTARRSPDTSSAPARASSAPASQSRAARMDRLRSSRSLSIALSLPTIILHRSDRIQ